MKRNLLKMVKILLILSICMSILAGCSGDTKEDEVMMPLSENFNETGYPIVNEPVTLSVIAPKHQRTDLYPTLKVFQDLEAKTNVKIEWEYAEGTDWNTQKSLLLASGDLPDVFFGKKVLSETDVINNLGLFLQMDEYIDKYCPNILAMFEEDPSMKQLSTMYDGNIYGLPQQMAARPSSFDMGFINQSWLDNLGFEMPTTTEELYNVLKAFKEKDANGNGDLNDEIPLTFMGFTDLTGMMSLYGAFGAVDSLNSNLSLTDGKVEYWPMLDGVKEGTKYMQRLYQEGLIDVEVFTQNWSIYPAKLNPEGDSIVGMAFHWGVQHGVGPERKDEYVPFMPVKGPNGDQYWRHNPQVVKNAKYVAMVTKDCEVPEIAMRWIDAIYDQETSMQLGRGAIGTTMEKTTDGKYLPLPATDGLSPEDWGWKFSMGDTHPGYVGDAFSEKIIQPLVRQEKLAADKEYTKYFKDEYFPLVSLTKEQSQEIAILSTDLTKYFQETIATWIVEGTDIDANWDEYISNMRNMGSDRFVEIYQEAYDALDR